MSHQSGITGSDDLRAAFAEAYSSETLRVIKIGIEEEVLTLQGTFESAGTLEDDWDNTILPLLDPKLPCYLLVRLDSKNSSGNDFAFVSWSPDFAHIRQKMVYASTRATVKQLFGSNYIRDEMFGTVEEDVNLAGYHKHKESNVAPPPLTMAEIEKAEIRAAETGVDIGASTKHTLATGVHFPIMDDAKKALEKLKSGSSTYVQLSLDTKAEVINLAESKNITVDSVAGLIPSDAPRYSVFNFKHNHEGDNIESAVFVYSCPGYQCSIKERMLYSTAKGPLIDSIEAMGINLVKKLEIGEGSEFTSEWLYDQLHPVKTVFKPKFARPSRPGRGGRRLTRRGNADQDEEEEEN